MHDSSPGQPKVSAATWVGLAIALFGILVIRQTVLVAFHSLTIAATIWRESLHWLCAVVLLLIVRRGEHLPLRSIGVGTCSLARSMAWSVVIALACLVVGFGI